MRQIIARAWKDTAESYGLTLGTGFRSLVVPITMFVLFYHVLGAPEAVSEGVKIALSLVAAGAAGFLPLFLWNLWLAPYTILNEKLDAIASTQENAKPIDEEAEQRGRLHVKREALRGEMEDLRRCIKAREERGEMPHYMQHVNDSDHDFITLKQRHAALIPSDFCELKMETWIGRIISTLTYYDYDEALERIKRAVATKSWKDEEGVS